MIYMYYVYYNILKTRIINYFMCIPHIFKIKIFDMK